MKNLKQKIKNNWTKIFSIFLFLVLFGAYSSIFAIPPATKYSPGEIRDPDCSPGDPNCSVEIGGGSGWSLTGNSGTSIGTNFIGTTDDIDLQFRRNNIISGQIGTSNTSYGLYSLSSNTAGELNSAFGAGSLLSNTTGNYNSAFGMASLGLNTTGDLNSAFGFNSLIGDTTGYGNSAFGAQSLSANTTGYGNSALGYVSGLFAGLIQTANRTSSLSVYLGSNTRASSDGDVNEIVIGANAIGNGSDTATIGDSNLLRTYLTGLNLKAGTAGAGTAPLKFNSGTLLGTPETGAIEFDGTHYYATIGSSRYQLDQQSGGSSPVTVVNTSNLFSTGLSGTGSGVTSTTNSIFLGVNAGNGATGAYSSNFIGYNAGNGGETSYESNFIGYNAGSGATSAEDANFIGVGAGYGATGAYSSTFIGYAAGNYATGAYESNFIGNLAGDYSSGAYSSNFFGSNAGYNAENAYKSTFFGLSAGSGATNASNSIFIGQQAGKDDTVNNTTDDDDWSILVGYNTSTGGFKNSILLGGSNSTTAIANTKANQFMLADTITDVRWRGIEYSLPSSQGSSGQVLTNNGSGGLSWGTVSSGVTPTDYLLDWDTVNSRYQPYSVKQVSNPGYAYFYGDSLLSLPTYNNVLHLDGWFLPTRLQVRSGSYIADVLSTAMSVSDSTHNMVFSLLTNEGYIYARKTADDTAAPIIIGEPTIVGGVLNGEHIKIDDYSRKVELNFTTIQFNKYGSGTHTGTATKWLAVDSSGNVIEEDAPSGGGLLSDADYNTVGGTDAGLNLVSGAQNNTFLGYQAGMGGVMTNAADYNTAIGLQSLYSNTTGYQNSAVGGSSLRSNTTGYQNSALGYNSLYSNTTGRGNSAVGQFSLYSNTTGSNNSALGGSSLTANTTGENNSSLGSFALGSNTTGWYNSALGIDSLYSNTTGYWNVAIGAESLNSNKTGSNGVAIGAESQYYANDTTTPWTNENTSVGYQSLRGSTTAVNNTGVRNTAIGYQSLFSNSTGSQNTAVGYLSLLSNTTGSQNTANGFQTLRFNSTGSQNTAMGYYSLGKNTTGWYNSTLGFNSLTNNTTGSNNSALGINSLTNNTTGGANSALGANSLLNNTTGDANSSLGIFSLNSNKTGSNGVAVGYGSQQYANDTTTSWTNYNTSVGYSSLRGSITPANNTGNYNTAIGYQTLFNNTTGNSNTANGYNSLSSITTGSNNIGIGYQAGMYVNSSTSPNETSSNSIYIGYDTQAIANGDTNEIVIGHQAIGHGSNTAQWGNTSILNHYLSGYVQFSSYGVGTLNTDASGNITASSDERLKDIEGNFDNGGNALDIINSINPILYKWNDISGFDQTTTYAGFSAQNIESLIPEAVGKDKKGYLTLSDRPILATAINAIKELDLEVKEFYSLDTSRATSLGFMIKSFIENETNRFEKIFTKTVVTEGIEMKDTATGEDYCVVITNGEFEKVKGKCGEPVPEKNDVYTEENLKGDEPDQIDQTGEPEVGTEIVTEETGATEPDSEEPAISDSAEEPTIEIIEEEKVEEEPAVPPALQELLPL